MNECAGYVCAQGACARCANTCVSACAHTKTDGRTGHSSSLSLKPGAAFVFPMWRGPPCHSRSQREAALFMDSLPRQSLSPSVCEAPLGTSQRHSVCHSGASHLLPPQGAPTVQWVLTRV